MLFSPAGTSERGASCTSRAMGRYPPAGAQLTRLILLSSAVILVDTKDRAEPSKFCILININIIDTACNNGLFRLLQAGRHCQEGDCCGRCHRTARRWPRPGDSG